jgi:hypothetical protein
VIRVTLDDKAARQSAMHTHVVEVGRSILDDHDGDAIFEQYLRLTRGIHNYSPSNKALIRWQAPDSRLVASKTAFDAMAAMQGHAAVSFESKKGKTWKQHVVLAAGSKAVWIWGPPRVPRWSEEVQDPTTGEVHEEERTGRVFFPAVPVHCVENVLYADDRTPLVQPDFVPEVDDSDLHARLLRYAASKSIDVRETGHPDGSRGTSSVGTITLQSGDPAALQAYVLLHEVGHELLHDLRAREVLPKSVKEAEATTFAAVVLRYLGHDEHVSAAYLRHWEATPRQVMNSMDRVGRAAAELVDFLESRGDPHCQSEDADLASAA